MEPLSPHTALVPPKPATKRKRKTKSASRKLMRNGVWCLRQGDHRNAVSLSFNITSTGSCEGRVSQSPRRAIMTRCRESRKPLAEGHTSAMCQVSGLVLGCFPGAEGWSAGRGRAREGPSCRVDPGQAPSPERGQASPSRFWAFGRGCPLGLGRWPGTQHQAHLYLSALVMSAATNTEHGCLVFILWVNMEDENG